MAVHKRSEVSIDTHPEEERMQRHRVINITGELQSLNTKELRFLNQKI